jgi:predicted  nucleic acid-binding Zn-ribbon protein
MRFTSPGGTPTLSATVSLCGATPRLTLPEVPVALVTEIRTLQELDDEVSSLRGALEDAERRLKGSEDLESARAAFASADAELTEARREQRRINGEVEGLTSRITPEEKRLYDGSVRNPKELSNIQHEVELLKAHRSKLEDELLEVMARLETAESAHSTAQRAFVRQEARWEADRLALADETRRLSSAIASIDAKRMAQHAKIPARNLAVYEDVRRRRGSAVARVAGGNCGGCRVSIPEAVRKRAFAQDSTAQCPNCERILYVG